MKFERATILNAFDQHAWRYAKRERPWDVDHHVMLWQTARSAFGTGDEAEFQTLYSTLQKKWQAMRRAQEKWDVHEAFERFMQLDAKYSSKRLTDLKADDVKPLWNLLRSVEGLKSNKYGSSVVAISKFLHFWNPRLFVIVDDAVIWNQVFGRWWLWKPFVEKRDETDHLLFGDSMPRPDAVCDLSSYLAVLFWCGDLLRANPQIISVFNNYLGSASKLIGSLPDAGTYEGAAVEWFLIGLINVPPAGVSTAESVFLKPI